MHLAGDLLTHRDNILADLHDAHDYYTRTKAAWRTVLTVIEKGATVRIRNMVTGSDITEKELPDTAQAYVTGFLASATLQQFVSSFEDFIFGVMRHWLLAYPKRLAKKQIPMSFVLAASNLDAVKLDAINRELNELAFKRVREWFAYLEDMVKLGCPTDEEIDRLAEIKATRDVFVHNRGIANQICEEKAGARKRGGHRDEARFTRAVSPGRLGIDPQGGNGCLRGRDRQSVNELLSSQLCRLQLPIRPRQPPRKRLHAVIALDVLPSLPPKFMQPPAILHQFLQHALHRLRPNIHERAFVGRQQVPLRVADEDDYRLAHGHRFQGKIAVIADQTLIEHDVRPAINLQRLAVRHPFDQIEHDGYAALLQMLDGCDEMRRSLEALMIRRVGNADWLR
jgi:hypothetical protein